MSEQNSRTTTRTTSRYRHPSDHYLLFCDDTHANHSAQSNPDQSPERRELVGAVPGCQPSQPLGQIRYTLARVLIALTEPLKPGDDLLSANALSVNSQPRGSMGVGIKRSGQVDDD
ncbi:MAG TPA: hypothetical protein VKQ72_20215 [Aggregatilineales bacterium]|nr:hypothetical protein [Aggregatilineales bacterium]